MSGKCAKRENPFIERDDKCFKRDNPYTQHDTICPKRESTCCKNCKKQMELLIDKLHAEIQCEKCDNNSGPPGRPGKTGAKGEKGDTGATGAKGDIGVTGEKGDIGATGATGAAGEKGEKGDIGATGAAGEKGEKGDIGATGATGEKGEKGECCKGEKGEPGTSGEPGIDGLPGPDGATGVVSSAQYVQLGSQPATVAIGQPFTYTTAVLTTPSTSISASTAVFNPPFSASGTVFTLTNIGRYEVNYQMTIVEDGGVVLYLGSTIPTMLPLPYTMIGKTPNGQMSGSVIIQTTTSPSFVSVNAAAGNSAAITVPPNSSTTNMSATTVSFKQIQ